MGKRKIIFMVISIIWMGIIFAFSARDGEESQDDSHEVGLAIGRLIVPHFEEKSEEQQMEFAKDIDHLIRKLAHATEYGILGMLLCCAFYDTRKKIRWYIPWGITTLYAATDEIHQVFVPGRDGNAVDVCIDSAGAFVGCILILLFFKHISGKKIES